MALAEIGYGIVAGVVSAGASWIISHRNGRRSMQSALTFEELEPTFAAQMVDQLVGHAQADEASVCIRNGYYDLSDDIKTRAFATVNLTSSASTNSTAFDCFFASGSGNLTIGAENDGSNFAINTGLQCTLYDLTLTCTA